MCRTDCGRYPTRTLTLEEIPVVPELSVLLPAAAPAWIAAPADSGGASRALIGGGVGVGSGLGSTLAWVLVLAALLLLGILARAVSRGGSRAAEPDATRSVTPEADRRDQW